jgi:capsular exopolysaccharide synthesis family protein
MQITSIYKDMDIKGYFSILFRRRWLAATFFFVTVTAVTIATFMEKEIYRATATVIVDVETPEILSVKDVVKLGEPNYLAYRDYIETQQEIIRSRRIAYNVMKNLKLSQRKEFQKAKDPIECLLKKLRVELVRDTRILKINIDDENPKLAALMANEFAKVYENSNIALKMRISSQAQGWLGQEVAQQEKKLRTSELKLQEYKESNNIVSIENQKNIIDEGLIKLNAAYVEAQKKRIQVETVYESLVDKRGDVILENLPSLLTDNKSLQQLKDDYLKQETLLTEYKKVYKNKHPKMIKLLETVGYLKLRIKTEVENEYNSALEEERKYNMELGEQKKMALGMERKIINYNALKREVEMNGRMLDIVLNRLKETAISSQIQANNVRVQDLAEVPRKPIKPKKVFNIVVSIILGVIGGAGLAFFREYMDATVKGPDEIVSLLNLPVLGCIPRIQPDGKNIKDKTDVDYVVEKDSHSIAAEIYRSIRTNLLFSINHSSTAKSIVITSSVPREGKTINAFNLATIIANSGERVVLVDADMRKPRVHRLFSQQNDLGLSEFLEGKKDFDDVIRYSGIDNLYFVTAGETTDRPVELISSQNMKIFIEKASFRFSKIIFDTPPVTLVTDAVVLSSIATGVILVAESNRVTKELLRNSKELLQKVNANILGIIVNNISPALDNYLYPQYYYGKYYNTV